MIDEQIENVIIEMQEKTENNKIKWISVNKLHNWNRIKSRIEKAKDENLKDFFIDEDYSYGFEKKEGYILLLNMRYSRASIFSPALDKHILIAIKNRDLIPINLSLYVKDGYRALVEELVGKISIQMEKDHEEPGDLYNFLAAMLEDDEDGRYTDE